MRIRPANIDDIGAMLKIERGSPKAAHWSQQQYESMFATPHILQGHEYLAWVAVDEAIPPEIVAFLVAHRVDRDWELENIVVAEGARRRGVGTRLLGELIACARARHGAEIFLEVRESNHHARALYRHAGFEETGLRDSYYSAPREDAILCRLRI